MVRQSAAFFALVFAIVPARADTIAILPFWNSDSSPAAANLDWIGESVAEMLRDTLAAHGVLGFERDEIEDSMHRLRLRGRVALSQASVIKIGEDLDSEQILFGSFTATVTPPAAPNPAASATTPAAPAPASRGSLKITARILDRRHLRLGPELIETGALEDLATVEAHLAWRVLSALSPNSAPLETDFKSLRPAVRLDAEESYVRGVLARDPAQKEKFFLQAARLDARLAHADYQLGQIHYQRKDYRQAADWLEKVPPDDPHYRPASFLLGLARFQAGDFAGAAKAFETIAATVPVAPVFNNLGAAESRRNLPAALDDFRKAVAADPTDPVYQFNLAYALWKKGDFSEAAEHFRAAAERDPDDQMTTLLLGRSLKKQGLHAASAGRDADARLTGLERLKTTYEERAYWMLKAVIDSKQ